MPARNWSLDPEHNLRWTGHGPAPCYYCGDPATGIDHTTPVSRTKGLDASALLELPELYADTVPCCQDCNSRLGNSYQGTLGLRKEELKRRLHDRWHRLIESPPWTEEELAKLRDGYFKDSIIAQLAFREHVLRRLRW